MYTQPVKYVAFLGGVNVGGKSTIPMSALKSALEKAGFKSVSTVLTSGNVICESLDTNPDTVTRTIENLIRKQWQRDIMVFVRTLAEIRKMDLDRPFKG